MLKNLRKAEGFTLIELIVVIAVLILLMAIALPSFLGVREKAAKADAKSAITTAYHDAKAEWADNEEAYPASAALVTALTAAEPAIDFDVEPALIADRDEDVVYVTTDADDVITLVMVKDGVTYTGTADEAATAFTVTP